MAEKKITPRAEDLLDFTTRAKRYCQYMEKVKTHRFVTGHAELDAVIRGVAPGDLLLIAAYSGTFKSALLQNMLMDYSLSSGLYSLMFSLEMAAEKIFEREIQIANDINGWIVEKNFDERNERARYLMERARQRGAGKVIAVEKTRLTLDHVDQYITLAKAKYEVGCMGIDYIGLLKGDSKTFFERMEDLTNGAKELAKDHGLPVIMLCQINRAAIQAQRAGAEIELDSLKGAVEAGADTVLGMYRNKENELIMKTLKNRNGPTGAKFLCQITPASFRFNSITKLPEEETQPQKGGKNDNMPF